ncbi:MAG: hypothetical protein Kilf2KO_33540 [Rhodospirillales bacterium]
MARLEGLLLQVNRALVAAALAAIFLIVFVNVVLRYGFGSSFAWAEETARFLMVFGAFAGAGLALRQGGLVAIEMLVDRLPRRLRLALRWGGLLVMGVFMALLVWFGWLFVEFGWNKETMATQISRGIPYMAIPFGAALFICHLLFFARRYVAGDFERAGTPEEAELDLESETPAEGRG